MQCGTLHEPGLKLLLELSVLKQRLLLLLASETCRMLAQLVVLVSKELTFQGKRSNA